MVSLIDMNYSTRFCKFSIDSVNDLSSLPTKTSEGKGILSTIRSCSQGSIAYSTDGNTYILSGEKNEWISYSGSSGGSSSGGESTSGSVTKSDIDSLFQED